MKRLATLSATLTLAWAGAASAATQVADGGFEVQGDTVSSFCYFPACPAGPWTGSGGGLQFEGNSAWPGAPTPDGDSYGFIQSTGFIEQVFTAADTGVFSLGWLDAGRPQGGFFAGNQTYDVLLNGATLGSFGTLSFQSFAAESTGSFNLFAGQSYTLRFQGRSTADNTAFIDKVELSYLGPISAAVPEPATWGLMILGFGGAGAMLRRRRSVLAA